MEYDCRDGADDSRRHYGTATHGTGMHFSLCSSIYHITFEPTTSEHITSEHITSEHITFFCALQASQIDGQLAQQSSEWQASIAAALGDTQTQLEHVWHEHAKAQVCSPFHLYFVCLRFLTVKKNQVDNNKREKELWIFYICIYI
jgi:hypothetical protein